MRVNGYGQVYQVYGWSPTEKPAAYLVDAPDANTTYIAYWEQYHTNGDERKQAVKKISVNGTETQIQWAWGKWSERTSLTYMCINREYETDED